MAATAKAIRPAEPAPVNDGCVSVAELADAFGCSTRTVEKYAAQGLIVRVSRGRYHFVSSVRKVVDYLRKQAATQQSGDGKFDAVAEGVLAKQAQRRLSELRIAQLEGTVISMDEVDQVWTALVVQNRQLVMSIPGRLRMEIPTMSGHEQKVAERVCHDLLTETAMGTGKRPHIKTKLEEVTL